MPPERNPETFPGLRMMGEMRMKGLEAEKIADAVNAAGYRTGSKRFGDRLFTRDKVKAILRNEFYCAFAPGDERGTVMYHGERYRGQHLAAFRIAGAVRHHRQCADAKAGKLARQFCPADNADWNAVCQADIAREERRCRRI